MKSFWILVLAFVLMAPTLQASTTVENQDVLNAFEVSFDEERPTPPPRPRRPRPVDPDPRPYPEEPYPNEPYPYPYPDRGGFLCLAEEDFGRRREPALYYGLGQNRRMAARRAKRKCRRFSRRTRCRISWCAQVR